MMKKGILPVFFMALALFAPLLTLSAQSESDLLDAMDERLPELMRLKLDGLVGESRLALLEPRGDLPREARRLVANENRDRLALYQLMAGRLKVQVEAVQMKRAEQIRKSSPEGVWLESPEGKWYRK